MAGTLSSNGACLESVARPANEGLTRTMSTAPTRPKLPSVLPSQPALQDGMCIRLSLVDTRHYRMLVSTTKDQINTGVARATNPVECVERLPIKHY